jgi:hypothetical protein
LTIRGFDLFPDNKIPDAKIGQQAVQVKANSDREMVFDVSSLKEGNSSNVEGANTLLLDYPGGVQVSAVVRIIKVMPDPLPADLVITSFNITPTTVIVKRDIVRATFVIKNQGFTDARAFKVTWQRLPGDPGAILSVPELKAGLAQSFSLEYRYLQAGNFDTVLTVDPDNKIIELKEDNNSETRRITVQLPPPSYWYQEFTVEVHADPGGLFSPSGECKDINYHYSVPQGWFIDRPKGDASHAGIHEVRNDSNGQANDSLRGYNYQPINETTVLVSGRICGAGHQGAGAVFSRKFGVYLIKPGT